VESVCRKRQLSSPMITKNAPEPVDNLPRVRSQKTIKLECAAIVLANGSRPFWVKLRNTQPEQMSSALPPTTDVRLDARNSSDQTNSLAR
jgi:hypothetical protein